MDLILLEKVQNLGDLGDLVKVKSGFGRNFLRAELEEAAKAKLDQAESRQSGLAEVTVEITANASEEGKLYGSIGPREVASAVSALGHEITKSEVAMGEGPIRTTGEFDVVVQLHADVESIVKVIVIPE
jgi:large subunit ribosomal protein L9